jgi:hypothetical protein
MGRRLFTDFHRDEQGFHALQAILVMAIGAVVIVAIKNKWPVIKKGFNAKIETAIASDT